MEFLKSVLFDRSFRTRENELNEKVDFNRPIAFKIELDGLTGEEYEELQRTQVFERSFVQAMKQTMGYVHDLYYRTDGNTPEGTELIETGVVIEDTGVIILVPRTHFTNMYYNNVMDLCSCISSVFTRALQSVATPFEQIIRNSVIVTRAMYLNSSNTEMDAEDYVTHVYNDHWDPQTHETMPNIYFIKPTDTLSSSPPEEGEVEEPYTHRDGIYTDWLEMINACVLERRHAGETDEDNDGDYIPSSSSDDSI
jgi:hypothetical protein